jgi:hypothetical protein
VHDHVGRLPATSTNQNDRLAARAIAAETLNNLYSVRRPPAAGLFGDR